MYVYILKCCDGSYYTGVTADMEKRFYEHREGIFPDCYTFNRRPVELVYYEECLDPLEAIAREKQVKDWSRAKKEALIKSDFNKLKELSRKKSIE